MTAARLARSALAIFAAVATAAVQPAAQQPAPAAPPAQQGAQAEPPVFRSGIDSVSVDVIVTDGKGRSVTDLTANDFEIREAGKPQTIEAFRLVQLDDGYADASAQRDILSPSEHAVEVASERNRLLVIFLDDYHTRVGNSLVIRQQLARFVSQLSPRDLVAITMPMLPASGLTFSRNHDATAGQLMSFLGRKYNYVPKYPIEYRYEGEPPVVQERLRNMWTIAALRALAEFMATFRVGRKTVLYVSEGMSNTLPEGALVSGTPLGTIPQSGGMSPQPGSAMEGQQLLDSMELISDLQRVFSAAARTNTAIYTIDPRGLASGEFSAADTVGIQFDRLILGQTTEMLRTIADQTDGRAIVNRNDPLPALQQMVKDGSSYYLLGYTSSSQFRDGKFHEIQVRVKRRDVEVRARKGYWAISADEAERAAAPKAEVRGDVSEALTTLVSVADAGRRQPVTLWLGAARGAAEKAQVTLVWESAGSGRDPAERVDHLNVTAETVSGTPLFSGRVGPEATTTTMPPAGVARFDAPAGTVRVRVEVQNAAGRRIESTDAVIDVPDFGTPTAQITTPFVFRGRTARDLQALRASASPLPTTGRSFSKAERLLLRFEAYGPGGTTPAVTMRILNQSGQSVASMPPPVKNGNVFESEFSLGAFPPSDYVIEISADANGDVTKRLLGIRVTG
ncbi:MAG: VWA domain-containing protein [Acidobacteria bacterium]|nr:VWA domain-containing protein [Acidobacteriota bacterium]